MSYYNGVQTIPDDVENSARDRLLLAAAQLLDGGGSLSTRTVCKLAGVTAPTLYYHFGSKQGLVDAVISHGFTQYVSPAGSPEASSDPVQDLRDGWDRHVLFGLEHPTFYALLYGRVLPGRPCAVTGPALEMLARLLDEVARRGGLRVPPREAAAEILATNVGVTLSLISQPETERDLHISRRVREAVLSSVLVPSETPSGGKDANPSLQTAAIALSAALNHDSKGLTVGELTLVQELMVRLSDSGAPGTGGSGPQVGRAGAD
jgi:AcrR family transcriptional regulator